MSKMFISKKQLLQDLESLTRINNLKPPFLYFLVLVGFMLTLILLLPIILLWCILLIIYIPLFFVDTIVLKLLNRKN